MVQDIKTFHCNRIKLITENLAIPYAATATVGEDLPSVNSMIQISPKSVELQCRGEPFGLSVITIKIDVEYSKSKIKELKGTPGKWTNDRKAATDGDISPAGIELPQESKYLILRNGRKASMTYFDQLQQFNSPNKVQITLFMLVGRPHSVRGIVAVTAVLTVHFILVAVMLYLFLANSLVSTIGNVWQTLSQIMRGEDKVKDERWKHRLRLSGWSRQDDEERFT
ncbi:hypothetical protein G7Y79_00011g030320 [Physcia stellaris]|nr:hypothetical protein G7Y79_00011g030320 [Physcia stellaris]